MRAWFAGAFSSPLFDAPSRFLAHPLSPALLPFAVKEIAEVKGYSAICIAPDFAVFKKFDYQVSLCFEIRSNVQQ